MTQWTLLHLPFLHLQTILLAPEITILASTNPSANSHLIIIIITLLLGKCGDNAALEYPNFNGELNYGQVSQGVHINQPSRHLKKLQLIISHNRHTPSPGAC